jgi:hypothetical protein
MTAFYLCDNAHKCRGQTEERPLVEINEKFTSSDGEENSSRKAECFVHPARKAIMLEGGKKALQLTFRGPQGR